MKTTEFPASLWKSGAPQSLLLWDNDQILQSSDPRDINSDLPFVVQRNLGDSSCGTKCEKVWMWHFHGISPRVVNTEWDQRDGVMGKLDLCDGHALGLVLARNTNLIRDGELLNTDNVSNAKTLKRLVVQGNKTEFVAPRKSHPPVVRHIHAGSIRKVDSKWHKRPGVSRRPEFFKFHAGNLTHPPATAQVS
jgi:hypothetical protein